MNEEEPKQETVDETTEEIVSQQNTPMETVQKKEKKHLQAVRLVEKAKQIVQESDRQAEECRLLLADDLEAYEEAKASLHAGGFDACTALLESLGYTHLPVETQKKSVVFEPKEEIAPMQIKSVSSGKFTGMLWSLFAGSVSAVGLVYLATEKRGMTLDVTKIPSEEEREALLSWFASAVGLEPESMAGAAVLGGAVVGVMVLVYAVRVALKGRKNLHFARKQFEEAQRYTEQKADCKAQMDKVDAHMKESISTLKMYEVLLNEQKGKLERILHIEGTKNKSTEYHEKSYAEIRESKILIKEIESFTALPMSKEGRLSQESVDALKEAKKVLHRALERLY